MKNKILHLHARRTRSASPGLSCGQWLGAALLCVACGGRTNLESERSSDTAQAGSGGNGGAQHSVSWDEIIWEESIDESVVYLWTASVTNTWAVLAAGAGGAGSFYRDHWDGVRWSHTLNESAQSDRFNAEQIWAAGEQAIAGSSKNLQRWSATPWLDWQNTPGCRAIAGSALDDIWCATESELWRFDGVSWTQRSMSGIRGIQARARDDVWVWGTGGASHFDGLRWTVERADLVSAVSASEATDVWALQDGDVLHSTGPGTGWTRQNPTGSSISGLWSQSKTNTWIAAAGAAMRWDGSNWQLVPLPNQDERLLISGSSEDVWIAGTQKLIHGHPTPR